MEVLLMKQIFALLLAAVSLISLTACAQPEAKTVSKYQLAAPQYPQMARYPDEAKFSRPNGDFDSDGFNQVYDAWQADRRKQTDQPEGYTDVLDGYLRRRHPPVSHRQQRREQGSAPPSISTWPSPCWRR